MIFLTYRCNLSCPYCFSKGQSGEFPIDRVLDLVEWAQANGVRAISFCGGEPTIYPGFSRVLDRLRHLGLKAYFATNLLADQGTMKWITPEHVDMVVVHVAHREVYAKGQWDRLIANLKQAKAAGVSIALRFSAYSPDHDWSHLFSLIEETELRRVRFALAFPAAGRDNAYVRLADFERMALTVLHLQAQCESMGVEFGLAKPVPLCLFPEDAQTRMVRWPGYTSLCNIFEDGFTRNACVSPGERVSPCLGIPSVDWLLSESSDWESLSRFCRCHIAPILDRPLFERCSECFLYERRLCQGACLGHKMEMLQCGS